MSLDLSALAVLCPPRKPRRPVAEKMLSIRVRDVRPLVEVGQETVQLPEIGRPLTLLWRWRSGGCLGWATLNHGEVEQKALDLFDAQAHRLSAPADPAAQAP